MTAQTPLVLGSTSKSFTALAVMQLVEAGKISLDAPVRRYLPWFRVGAFDNPVWAHRHFRCWRSGCWEDSGLEQSERRPPEHLAL